MLSHLSFRQNFNDAQNTYYFKEGFSKEELNKIEKDVENVPFQKADTMGGNDEVRSSRVKWIYQTAEWKWLYDKLGLMAVEANNTLWNFNLYSMPEAIQYTEYLGTNKGHYDWHADIGPDYLSLRKISITVQLSEADEYEGGDLEIFTGGSMNGPFPIAPRKAGCVFIFPSYLMHRVTPVTKGIRKSFVLWLGGEHYK